MKKEAKSPIEREVQREAARSFRTFKKYTFIRYVVHVVVAIIFIVIIYFVRQWVLNDDNDYSGANYNSTFRILLVDDSDHNIIERDLYLSIDNKCMRALYESSDAFEEEYVVESYYDFKHKKVMPIRNTSENYNKEMNDSYINYVYELSKQEFDTESIDSCTVPFNCSLLGPEFKDENIDLAVRVNKDTGKPISAYTKIENFNGYKELNIMVSYSFVGETHVEKPKSNIIHYKIPFGNVDWSLYGVNPPYDVTQLDTENRNLMD